MDPSSLGKPRRQGPCRSYSSAPLPCLFPRSSVESSMPHLAVRRGLCCLFSPSQCFTFLNLGGTSHSAPVFLYHRGSHSVGRGALGIPHSSRGPQGTCGFFTWLTFAPIVQKVSGYNCRGLSADQGGGGCVISTCPTQKPRTACSRERSAGARVCRRLLSQMLKRFGK